MNNKLKLEIIEHLEKLGNGEIKPVYLKRGVCSEIFDKFGIDLNNIIPFDKCPNFSGYVLCPVHHCTKSPMRAFLETRNKWAEIENLLVKHIKSTR